jgi:hypothetical protein
MIDKQIPWTTNLDQLGWSVAEFVIILAVIIYTIERCK